MKKTLILTAFLGVLTFAAAQDTTGTSTDATSTDMSTAATSTDATSSDATSTDTSADSSEGTSMDMSGTSTDETSMAAMSPADAYAQAQALASQADVAYPVPFYDRTLWKQAVDSAYMAKSGDMQNRDYAAYLAQLYTKTQWWINAYNAWQNLGDLTDQEKDWASLSAAKLAYIALQSGNKDLARQYVNAGMAWKDTPSLDAIMKRL